MKREHSTNRESTAKPARVDKTLEWLTISRDSWKEKTKEIKTKLKITKLALKRAREHRDKFETEFKEERRNIKKQLNQKDAEIAILKNKLERATQEAENLKKKK
jgi:ribosomal protein L7/L12